MPLYEYECDACHRRFERIQKFSDPPADVCVHCGKGPVKKLLSSPAIQFKGSGFYINDYARKSSGGDSSSGKSSSSSGDASSSTTPSSGTSSSGTSSSGSSGTSDSATSKPADKPDHKG